MTVFNSAKSLRASARMAGVRIKPLRIIVLFSCRDILLRMSSEKMTRQGSVPGERCCLKVCSDARVELLWNGARVGW